MSIVIDSLDISCNAKDINLSTEVAELDTTGLCADGWTSVIGGLKSGTVSIGEIMQDIDAEGLDDTVFPLLGTANIVKSICTSSADGSVAYLWHMIPLSYTPVSGEVGQLAGGSLSGASSSGPVVRGTVLAPTSTVLTASADGTGRQLGTVAAGQSIYLNLHVVAASGTSPTLDVIVESDDDPGFGTPLTRGSFTQATGRTSERLRIAGAITDDYWRVGFTVGGTDPSFTVAVTAGII